MKSTSSHNNQSRQKAGCNCNCEAESSNIVVRNIVKREDSGVFDKLGFGYFDWVGSSIFKGASISVDWNSEGFFDDFSWYGVDVSSDVAPGTRCDTAQKTN